MALAVDLGARGTCCSTIQYRTVQKSRVMSCHIVCCVALYSSVHLCTVHLCTVKSCLVVSCYVMCCVVCTVLQDLLKPACHSHSASSSYFPFHPLLSHHLFLPSVPPLFLSLLLTLGALGGAELRSPDLRVHYLLPLRQQSETILRFSAAH